MKTALITGITGQDGAYLAEFLLEKGYRVFGIKRRSSSFNTERVDSFYENRNFKMVYGDLADASSVLNIIKEINPDEIYNLGAQSHVRVSFDIPEYTADIDALGVLRILDAVRTLGLEKKVRFYQASSSEMFGEVVETPQKETTPFYPRSPYGVAKVFGFWITKNYRESYEMFTSNGILFNHESPKRGETFVTRKITRAVSRISFGLEDFLVLGNLDAKRDWGHAKDYVKAMWMILQAEKADDFVIATGKQYSVREFVERAFKYIGKEILWQGEGVNEIGLDKITGAKLVSIDPKYFRPAEVETLLGDSTKAKDILGWTPETSFEKLIEEMMENDMKLAEKERYLKDGNFK